MPTISLHDLINGTRRPTPHRYIRDTCDIYMYVLEVQLRFTIHKSIKTSTGLAQHDTRREMFRWIQVKSRTEALLR